jgi:hypothetical protein
MTSNRAFECLLWSASYAHFQSVDASGKGRKRSFKEDAAFWVIAGFDLIFIGGHAASGRTNRI